MTQREKDLFYEVLELLRKEVRASSDFGTGIGKMLMTTLQRAHLRKGILLRFIPAAGAWYTTKAQSRAFILSVHLTQNYFAYMRHMP